MVDADQGCDDCAAEGNGIGYRALLVAVVERAIEDCCVAIAAHERRSCQVDGSAGSALHWLFDDGDDSPMSAASLGAILGVEVCWLRLHVKRNPNAALRLAWIEKKIQQRRLIMRGKFLVSALVDDGRAQPR